MGWKNLLSKIKPKVISVLLVTLLFFITFSLFTPQVETSQTASITVSLTPTKINANLATTVIISGRLTEMDNITGISSKTITLTWPGGSATTTTDIDGYYSYFKSVIYPKGTYVFKASFAGDATYEPASNSAILTVASQKRTIKIYSIPIEYLGKDPESISANDIHATIKVNYVQDGQSKSVSKSTVYEVDADIYSMITFKVTDIPSIWSFNDKWYDHDQFLQYTASTLSIQVVSGTGPYKISAFFSQKPEVIPLTIKTNPQLAGVHFKVDGIDYYKGSDNLIVQVLKGNHTVELVNTTLTKDSNSKHTFTSWAYFSSYGQSLTSSSASITLETPYTTATANFQSQYKMSITTSGLPNGVPIKITVKDVSHSKTTTSSYITPFTHVTDWFNEGDIIGLSITPTEYKSGTASYKLKYWINSAEQQVAESTLFIAGADNFTAVYYSTQIEDKIPPAVSVTINPERSDTTQPVSFTVTANDDKGGSGISSVILYVDNSPVEIWTAAGIHNFTGGSYAEGTHTYYAIATDKAGNIGREPSSGNKSFNVTFTPSPTPTPSPTLTPTPTPPTPIPTTTPTPTIITSSISITVSPIQVDKGQPVTISGSLSPPVSDAIIRLTYIKAGEVKVERTVKSFEGLFTDRYIPDSGGSWSVKASWKGDIVHKGSESKPFTFEVVDKGCLIATSTYGSPMAPEVQFLRSFRESIVYSTFAGRSFMAIFNAFYYNWSPVVANQVWHSSFLNLIGKALISPLLGILHISTSFYSAVSFNPELGIVLTGLVAAALIGVTYFMPLVTIPLILFNRRRKSISTPNSLKILAIPWVISLVLIIIGEITMSSLFMMTGTGAFIIFTIAIVSGTGALKIVNRI